VGGGEVSTKTVEHYASLGWRVVCADSGANRLKKTGVVPEIIIGDMDSLAGIDGWRTRARVLEIAEQDTTDFEKCLYSIEAPLYVACGFTGDRFDHTLAGLHVLQKYVATHRVIMSAGNDICFACDGDLAINLPTDNRFSIYPLTPTMFKCSSGLHYPLESLLLEQGGMIGTSNRTNLNGVELKIEYGVYAVILPKALLGDVVLHLLPQT